MAAEKGSLSINSENMFPIIKKWLYSDHDIFFRELISNGCDAITKLKKLDMMGDFELPEGYKPRIDVVVDPAGKTIEVSDNGLGMTADEVKEYINNIAFSGAAAFMEKYKDKANDDQIIGHFGLGFYSVFMVSDLVTIDTLSYQSGAQAVHWECDGGSTYSMEDGNRSQFGTTVTLHLSEDCVEFANYYRAKEVIQKYCSFMPVEIYLSEKDTKQTEVIKESERRPDDVVIEEVVPEKKEEDSSTENASSENKEPEEKKFRIRRRPELLNDTHPLWLKTPHDCTDEEYKDFYRKVFHDYKEPLFWIHLNMDYPFNLKGILYFPKLNLEYESAEGVIKLYNNQVFIADNIKEVIPEFLMLLKGVIDCPDLPLNVSRSALQNDGFVQKISDYITKKVADKLSGMCKTDKENYEKYWDDIAPFIKYGCLKDEKFCKKMTDYILFKDLDGKYLTLPEALEVNKTDVEEGGAVDENGEKVEAEVVDEKKDEAEGDKKDEEEKKDRTIYYVTDEQQQGQYIRMFRNAGMQAFILNQNIDQPFISQLEMKNEGIHFARIDADVQEALRNETAKDTEEDLKKKAEPIEKILQEAENNKNLKVKIEKLKDKNVSSMLTIDEQSRRMMDMMNMYAAAGMGLGAQGLNEGQTLILNADHPLVQYVTAHAENADKEDPDAPLSVKTLCEQLYDMARIQNAPLEPAEMEKFITRTNAIMMKLAGAQPQPEEVAGKQETAAEAPAGEAEAPAEAPAEDAKEAADDTAKETKDPAEGASAETAAEEAPEE